MNQPTNHGPVADACKPFDRTVFDIIVAAVDSPIPTESGLRQRGVEEKFFGMWGVFEASQVSRWPEHSPLHQGVNFLLCDDGLRFRATPELEGRDEFLEWHPLRCVEHGADKKPLLPFPFDGTDLAIYMVRGPGSFIMSMLTACLEDAGGDLDAAVKLMVPVKPFRCVPDETARLALTEALLAWRQAAVLIELDPANAAGVAASDLARAGEMVAALHSRRASAFEVAALSAPASELSAKQSPVSEWPLKSPRRNHGLSTAIYRSLKAAREAGERIPTAVLLLEKWRGVRPSEVIRVTHDTCDYFDRYGAEKSVNLEQLRRRIETMTTRK